MYHSYRSHRRCVLYPHAGPSLPEARGVLKVWRAVSQPGPRGLYNTIVQIKLITGNKAPNTGPITGLLKANILQPSLHHGGHCGPAWSEKIPLRRQATNWVLDKLHWEKKGHPRPKGCAADDEWDACQQQGSPLWALLLELSSSW